MAKFQQQWKSFNSSGDEYQEMLVVVERKNGYGIQIRIWIRNTDTDTGLRRVCDKFVMNLGFDDESLTTSTRGLD